MSPEAPRPEQRIAPATDRRHAIRRAIDRQEHRWERARRYLGMFFIAAAFGVIYVQEHRIDSTQHDQRVSRVNVTSLFCAVLDANAVISDEQTALFQSIILNGTIQGRAFESLYRSHGFPPYAKRLQQAKALSGKVGALQAKVIDCHRLQAVVAANRPLTTSQLAGLSADATGRHHHHGPRRAAYSATGPTGPKR